MSPTAHVIVRLQGQRLRAGDVRDGVGTRSGTLLMYVNGNKGACLLGGTISLLPPASLHGSAIALFLLLMTSFQLCTVSGATGGHLLTVELTADVRLLLRGRARRQTHLQASCSHGATVSICGGSSCAEGNI